MMARFDITMVPVQKRVRYFIRDGASTNFQRGFRSKREVEEWTHQLCLSGNLDWRCGGVFRVKGYPVDLKIVNRKGEVQ